MEKNPWQTVAQAIGANSLLNGSKRAREAAKTFFAASLNAASNLKPDKLSYKPDMTDEEMQVNCPTYNIHQPKPPSKLGTAAKIAAGVAALALGGPMLVPPAIALGGKLTDLVTGNKPAATQPVAPPATEAGAQPSSPEKSYETGIIDFSLPKQP